MPITKEFIINEWNLTVEDVYDVITFHEEGFTDSLECTGIHDTDEYKDLLEDKFNLFPSETLLFISCIDLDLFLDEIKKVIRESGKYCFNSSIRVEYFPTKDDSMIAGYTGYDNLMDFLAHKDSYDVDGKWNEERFLKFLKVFVNTVNKTYLIKINWYCLIDHYKKQNYIK